MKICIFILFLVLNTVICEKKQTKLQKKRTLLKINDKCKNIKCSTVEDRECLKIKDKKNQNRSIYIITLNKCEMEYMKCHDDFEATVVPMKHCGHHTLITLADKNSKLKARVQMKNVKSEGHRRSKRHVRVKRDAKTEIAETTPFDKPQVTPGPQNGKTSGQKTKPQPSKMTGNVGFGYGMAIFSEEDTNSQDMHYKETQKTMLSRGLGGYKTMTVEENPPVKTLGFSNEDTAVKLSAKDKREKDDSQLTYKNAQPVTLKNGPQNLNRKGANKTGEAETQTSEENEEYQEIHGKGNPQYIIPDEEQESEMVMDSGEAVNKLSNKAANNELPPDTTEFESDCPTMCPSHDVMVCAKCQHGIYRTFVSVCHMRMFSCKHKDDALELISREPCVLSAPYLSEDGMHPKGEFHEAADLDPILKFIICRDRSRLSMVPGNIVSSCDEDVIKLMDNKGREEDDSILMPETSSY